MILEMLVTEPNDVFLNYALAIELETEKEFDAAEQQLLKTLEVDQNYLPCFYRLGQIAEKIKTPEEAIAYYKRGLDLAKKQNDTKTANELNEAIWLLEE